MTSALTVLLLLAAVALCLWLIGRNRKDGIMLFANVAEGIHESGNITKLSDGAITTRYLLAKIGTDIDHVDLAGTADIPLGVITDEASAAGLPVNVALFGAAAGTLKVVASAAITAGALVVSAASGKVRTLPGTTGTYYIIGRALVAASADGDIVEIAPMPCIQRVVP